MLNSFLIVIDILSVIFVVAWYFKTDFEDDKKFRRAVIFLLSLIFFKLVNIFNQLIIFKGM